MQDKDALEGGGQPENNAPKLKENLLPREMEQILQNLPHPQKEAVRAVFTGMTIKRQSFSSPIPPPEMLQGYNEVIPNGAERILQMAEKQSEHRMELEKSVIKEEQRQSGRGQNYALFLSAMILLIGGVLIYLGHDNAGCTIVSINIVGLATVFVLGKYYKPRDPK